MESLLDFLGDRSYGATLLQIERVNHQGLGVETSIFDRFYYTVMGTFRDILGPDWTPEMDKAWSRVLRELTAPATIE
jgi:hemoglobin-like flavoprotein